MTIINRIYGNYIEVKYQKEIEEFKDEVLGILAEEIVKKHSRIVKEVLDSNTMTRVNNLRKEALELEVIKEQFIESPLSIDIENLHKLNNADVKSAIEKLESIISKSEFEGGE